MISFSSSWIIYIVFFIIMLMILYYIYKLRKLFFFQQTVLESFQNQLIQFNQIVEQHEQILFSMTGRSTYSPIRTPDVSAQQISHPTPVSTENKTSGMPQGLMSNFLYLMNAVASTPPSPNEIIEKEFQHYQDTQDTDEDSTISNELEEELKELEPKSELKSDQKRKEEELVEGRLDEKVHE